MPLVHIAGADRAFEKPPAVDWVAIYEMHDEGRGGVAQGVVWVVSVCRCFAVAGRRRVMRVVRL